jgi:hypothetical protein
VRDQVSHPYKTKAQWSYISLILAGSNIHAYVFIELQIEGRAKLTNDNDFCEMGPWKA